MKIFGFEIIRPKKNTALHPDFKKFIEYAFEIDGVKFYHFKNYLDMPIARYSKMNEFVREAELRLTRDDLKEYIEDITKHINEGQLTKVSQLIALIEYRLDQFIELESYYRLFSAAFFTLEENIAEYDYDYNEWKINLFKKQNPPDFFLSNPMKELLPPVNISKEDMQTFLKAQNTAKQYEQKIKSKDTTKEQK